MKILGYLLIGYGVLQTLGSLLFGLSSRGFPFGGLVFGLICLAGGWFLIKRPQNTAVNTKQGGAPPVPPGFNASYWNKNIALDATTGSLWLREGFLTTILQRGDVLGWEMKNSNFSSQSVIGPRLTPMDNQLIIKTKNLDKPVWTINFDAHTSLTGAGNHANHRELKDWYERLNVIFNH